MDPFPPRVFPAKTKVNGSTMPVFVKYEPERRVRLKRRVHQFCDNRRRRVADSPTNFGAVLSQRLGFGAFIALVVNLR
jgi:hypothetical protein